MQFDSSKMNEEEKEVLKNLGGEIALFAEFNEFHIFGLLLSVISVEKKRFRYDYAYLSYVYVFV